MSKIRVVLFEAHIEKLLDQLNDEYSDWTVLATIQEHGYTKVLLEKDK